MIKPSPVKQGEPIPGAGSSLPSHGDNGLDKTESDGTIKKMKIAIEILSAHLASEFVLGNMAGLAPSWPLRRLMAKQLFEGGRGRVKNSFCSSTQFSRDDDG